MKVGIVLAFNNTKKREENQMTFTREKKIQICMMIDQENIPVGAIAEALYGTNPEMKNKFKNTLNNWYNSWKKALENGQEPFPGRGRRVTEYDLNSDQKEALEKIAEILSK